MSVSDIAAVDICFKVFCDEMKLSPVLSLFKLKNLILMINYPKTILKEDLNLISDKCVLNGQTNKTTLLQYLQFYTFC